MTHAVITQPALKSCLITSFLLVNVYISGLSDHPLFAFVTYSTNINIMEVHLPLLKLVIHLNSMDPCWQHSFHISNRVFMTFLTTSITAKHLLSLNNSRQSFHQSTVYSFSDSLFTCTTLSFLTYDTGMFYKSVLISLQRNIHGLYLQYYFSASVQRIRQDISFRQHLQFLSFGITKTGTSEQLTLTKQHKE